MQKYDTILYKVYYNFNRKSSECWLGISDFADANHLTADQWNILAIVMCHVIQVEKLVDFNSIYADHY